MRPLRAKQIGDGVVQSGAPHDPDRSEPARSQASVVKRLVLLAVVAVTMTASAAMQTPIMFKIRPTRVIKYG